MYDVGEQFVLAVPFAPLCRLPENVPLLEGLESVIRRVVERLEREAPGEQGRKLWTATYLLTGLRVSPEQAHTIFQRTDVVTERHY